MRGARRSEESYGGGFGSKPVSSVRSGAGAPDSVVNEGVELQPHAGADDLRQPPCPHHPEHGMNRASEPRQTVSRQETAASVPGCSSRP
jgi:hypothetical protein